MQTTEQRADMVVVDAERTALRHRIEVAKARLLDDWQRASERMRHTAVNVRRGALGVGVATVVLLLGVGVAFFTARRRRRFTFR